MGAVERILQRKGGHKEKKLLIDYSLKLNVCDCLNLAFRLHNLRHLILDC